MVAAIVMLAGIGFLTVVTAAITAAFIESARSRSGRGAEARIAHELREISARLERIERRLDAR